MGFIDAYKADCPFKSKNVRKRSFPAFSVPMMPVRKGNPGGRGRGELGKQRVECNTHLSISICLLTMIFYILPGMSHKTLPGKT